MTSMTMETLLDKCGLKDKYNEKFQKEGMTIERFEKVQLLNQGSFTQTFLEKMNMTCGDYIQLLETLESDKVKRHNSNLKLALSSSEKDIYRTPPAFDLMKKTLSSYASSVNSNHDSESPSHLRLMKVSTKDQSTQTFSL